MLLFKPILNNTIFMNTLKIILLHHHVWVFHRHYGEKFIPNNSVNSILPLLQTYWQRFLSRFTPKRILLTHSISTLTDITMRLLTNIDLSKHSVKNKWKVTEAFLKSTFHFSSMPLNNANVFTKRLLSQ